MGNGVSTSISFGETQYLFPSFLQRLVLRAGSMTPAASQLTRSLIDRYRVKHRTSANQSVASWQPPLDASRLSGGLRSTARRCALPTCCATAITRFRLR